MSSRTYLTNGIILDRREYREYDRILTIYTQDYGKIEAVARGVRKIVSKLAGHLEPLTYASFMLARGRTFDIIATSVKRSSFRLPHHDLMSFLLVTYLFEAVDRLTRQNEPDPALFKLLIGYLETMENHVDRYGGPPSFQRTLLTLYSFVQLLKLLGYSPALERCVVGREALAGNQLFLSLREGGLVCPAHQRGETVALSRQTAELLRLMTDGHLEAVRFMNRRDQALKEIALIINSFFKHHLGEPLASERFLATVTAYFAP